MKRFVAVMLAVSLVAPTVAHADIDIPMPQTPPGEISVGPAVSPMKKGQTAPFSGVLLSPEAVAKVIVDYNNQKAQSKIEADKAREIQKAQDQLVIDNLVADLRREKEISDAQRKSASEQMQVLNKQLDESEKNKPNATTAAGLGALAGAALVVLSMIAIGVAK